MNSPLSRGGGGQLAIAALLTLTAMIWGGTFAAGKLAAREAAPLAAAFWRFVLAALILVPQLRLTQKSLAPKAYRPSTWGLLFLSGLTGLALYNFFFVKGLALTGAGRGAVIVTINPVFIYLGSALFFREKITLARLAGVSLALLGTLIVVSAGDPGALLDGRFNLGDLFMLGCVASWSAYSLIGKLLMGRLTPLAANAWSTLFAIAALLPPLLASGELSEAWNGYSAATWLSLAFLGIFGSALGFTFFFKGILVLGPHKAAIFISLVPFFGVLAGAWIHGEALEASTFVGLAFSLMGIAIVQKH
ncbi:MAG: DMT family transporter [Deltaproteobacteria bacterium]|nr:DMT family transporter [Deltaproteobacteria bacterium]